MARPLQRPGVMVNGGIDRKALRVYNQLKACSSIL